MRHGQASAELRQDSQRPLLDEGCAEVTKMAAWLSASDTKFNQILVSPFVRAQQTAKIIQTANSPTCLLTSLHLITPAGQAKQVHDYIDGLLINSPVEKMLIVSHMPLVSYLVAELTFDSDCPIFQTAGIAQIDYQLHNNSGRLVHFVAPNDIVDPVI